MIASHYTNEYLWTTDDNLTKINRCQFYSEYQSLSLKTHYCKPGNIGYLGGWGTNEKMLAEINILELISFFIKSPKPAI